MNKLINIFGNFIKVDGWIFFILLILNITPVIQTFVLFGKDDFEEFFYSNMIAFYFGAVGILTFCLIIHFVLAKFPRTKIFLQILILIGFAISFVVDAFLIYTFGVILHGHLIEIVLGTNPVTVKEFFQAYILTPKIICAIIMAFFLIGTSIKKFRSILKNLSENNLRRISFSLMIMFLPVILFAVNGIVFYFLMIIQYDTIFGRNVHSIYTAIKISNNEDEIFAEMDAQDEKIISNNSKIPYVIFVLGESETRNHMQIYGYNLKNTPLAVKRYERGELFKFNDVIACANDTSAAMKLIFTFAEKKDSDELWYTNSNIFDIVRSAGYHTAWISNQSPIGWLGNLDKIYAERCDEKYFTEKSSKKNTTLLSRDFDGVLLPILDNFISQAQNKNFYVLHLYGSHVVYNERYPAEFSKFTAADEDKPTETAKQAAAEYDNAILYTDFILDEIFKRFEDKNALIIYISDHGEEVYENGRNFAGHSVEEIGNLSMIETPMLVWTSKSFREMYPEKITALKNSADNPYRTDFLIHTILDLMDIQTENFDATKSIVNEKFDKFRIRIYNGKTYTKN